MDEIQNNALPEGAIPVDQFEAMPATGQQSSGMEASAPPEGAIPIDQFQSQEAAYGH
jgi:hypothetical protein